MTKQRGGVPAILIVLGVIALLAPADGFAQCIEPGEVQQLAVSRSGTAALIEWTPPGDATSSELVRGDLRTGQVNVIGVGQTCLGNDLVGQPTSYTETVNPPSQRGYWYLVRATNECGKGPWGESLEGGQSVPRVTECGCHPDFATPDRYIATEKTVSDRRTCLEWEKKTATPDDPLHSYLAVNTFYALRLDNPNPGWVTKVNTERYAGHSDWRLPSSSGPLSNPTGEPAELETLLTVPCPRDYYLPCIDDVFGPFPQGASAPGCDPPYCNTSGPQYWSGSTVTGSPSMAWTLNFVFGGWAPDFKQPRFWFFRAVRGTLYGE